MKNLIALTAAMAAATSPALADELGPSYIREPISAQCAIEVARATKQEHELVGNAAMREATRAKARRLSSIVGGYVDFLRDYKKLYAGVEREVNDANLAGLSSEAELKWLQTRRIDASQEVTEMLSSYPSCGMLDSYPGLSTVLEGSASSTTSYQDGTGKYGNSTSAYDFQLDKLKSDIEVARLREALSRESSLRRSGLRR